MVVNIRSARSGNFSFLSLDGITFLFKGDVQSRDPPEFTVLT